MSADPQDVVSVFIEYTEQCRYAGTVNLTREQFAAYEKSLDAGGAEARKAAETIADLLNRQDDWQDARDPDIEAFRIENENQAEGTQDA